MTQAEQSIADDKMRVEISKLQVEVAKLQAEIPKIVAEARSITVNTFLAPALAAAGLMGATAALVKILLT